MKRIATLGGAALAVLIVLATADIAAAAPQAKKTAMTQPAASAMVAPAAMASVSAGEPGAKADAADTARARGTGATGPKAKTGPHGDRWHPRDRSNRRNQDHGMTGILVPIAFFLCILLLVGTIQYIGFRKDRNRHQTLQLMVEKGAQIPVELITPQKRRGSDLRRGLILVGTGLGIVLFLLITKDARQSGAWGLGLIPALIGAGYLLAWRIERKNNGNGPGASQTYINGGSYGQPPNDRPDNGDANG